MIPLLAQAAAPTFTVAEFSAVCGVIVFILGAAFTAKKLFGHEPPLHKEYAPRTELEKLEKKLETETAKQQSSRKGIYSKLEEHGEELASLRAEYKGMHAQLTNMDGKMDQVLMRLPRKES